MKIFILSLGIVTGMCSLIHAAGAHPLLKHIWEIFHQRDLLSQSSQHVLANAFIFSVPKDGGVITCAFSNKKGWWSCFHNVLWFDISKVACKSLSQSSRICHREHSNFTAEKAENRKEIQGYWATLAHYKRKPHSVRVSHSLPREWTADCLPNTKGVSSEII